MFFVSKGNRFDVYLSCVGSFLMQCCVVLSFHVIQSLFNSMGGLGSVTVAVIFYFGQLLIQNSGNLIFSFN